MIKTIGHGVNVSSGKFPTPFLISLDVYVGHKR